MPVDNAENTLGTAKELNITAGLQTFVDRIDTLDTNDYYRFSFTKRSSLNFHRKRPEWRRQPTVAQQQWLRYPSFAEHIRCRRIHQYNCGFWRLLHPNLSGQS